VILPYHNIVYTLRAEADSLLYHCKKSHFDKCKVIAYNLSGKCIKDNWRFADFPAASTDIEVFNSNLRTIMDKNAIKNMRSGARGADLPCEPEGVAIRVSEKRSLMPT
jgi:hypothetical protein